MKHVLRSPPVWVLSANYACSYGIELFLNNTLTGYLQASAYPAMPVSTRHQPTLGRISYPRT